MIDKLITHEDGEACACGPAKKTFVRKTFVNELGNEIKIDVEHLSPTEYRYSIESKWSRADHTLTAMEVQKLLEAFMDVMQP